MTKTKPAEVPEDVLPKGTHNWYRSKRWSAEIEAAFFQKLGRCRTQRDQHLAIQVIELEANDPEAAEALGTTYFETRKDGWHDGQVYIPLIRIAAKDGRHEMALGLFDKCLAWQKHNPGHIVGVEEEYIVWVARSPYPIRYDHALELASQLEPAAFVFEASRFRIASSLALILDAKGQATAAQDNAVSALDMMSNTQADFPRHRSVGRIGDVQSTLLADLKRIAGTTHG